MEERDAIASDYDYHVLHPRFGLSLIGERTVIDDLLARVKDVGSISAQILLREAYETIYRIYDHDAPDPSRPLAMVAMHEKENVTEHGALYNAMRRYAASDIARRFNLTPGEFFSYPREITALLFNIVAKESAEIKEPPKGGN